VIKAPRGTSDVLPSQQPLREWLVAQGEATFRAYGYRRISTPTFEETELFARTSGEGSDVVQKEMYTFADRAGRSLTLRPEATAPVARAYVQHGLHRDPQPVKTFMVAPMYRYAAPQKGRYREFWQLNVEAMGSDDPAVDAEVIQLFAELLGRLELRGWSLQLNSIGDRACRPGYVARLEAWLDEHDELLDDDARQKRRTSPLRVFDTKAAKVQQALAAAPKITDALCDDCRAHFDAVRAYLRAYGVPFEEVPTLVRGLDYYTRTAFEFVGEALGAQSALGGGGRYDYLIEEIGGPPTPGVGWAAGIERLLISLEEEGRQGEPPRVDVFFVVEPDGDRIGMLRALAELRRRGLAADADYAGRSVKGQFTQASRLGARVTVVVGADGARIRPRGGDERLVSLEEVPDAL
jgi:histidyl-tRNA synthetase